MLDRPQYVADWVARRSGGMAPTVDAAIGVEHDGQLRAGVYFDGLTSNNIFAHIANDLPMIPRLLLAAGMRYVFRQLELERVTFAFPSGHSTVLRLMSHLGAQYEGRLRRAFGAQDMLWFVLWGGAPMAQAYMNRTE